jgi:hypothetical protein
MVAVKNYINDAAPEHTSVPVLASSRTAPSWPADRVDRIGRRFLSSMPDPKLPEPQGQSEGK